MPKTLRNTLTRHFRYSHKTLPTFSQDTLMTAPRMTWLGAVLDGSTQKGMSRSDVLDGCTQKSMAESSVLDIPLARRSHDNAQSGTAKPCLGYPRKTLS